MDIWNQKEGLRSLYSKVCSVGSTDCPRKDRAVGMQNSNDSYRFPPPGALLGNMAGRVEIYKNLLIFIMMVGRLWPPYVSHLFSGTRLKMATAITQCIRENLHLVLNHHHD